jgi:hypothetical protein
MADTIYAPDPWSALSAQHSDIRREGSVERGEIRYDVATQAADGRYTNAAGQGDIRREQALGFGDTKYSIAEHSEATNRDILTTGANVAVKVDEAADKIQQRAVDFFIAEQARDFDMGRDLSDLKATVLMANQKTAGDIALASERAVGATALAQAQTGKEIAESKYDLARQIGIENEKTRDLINALKNDELNRILIERNTDLQGCRSDYWGARDGLFNTQFAALSSQVNSQVNALNSQLAETRQGLVNFGTMAGNAGQQSSTSNQVR